MSRHSKSRFFLRSHNFSCENFAHGNGQKSTKHVHKVGKTDKKNQGGENMLVFLVSFIIIRHFTFLERDSFSLPLL